MASTLRYWKFSALTSNTLLATAWQGARLVLQLVYLILVARMLGVDGYGVFAGCVGLAASLSPIVGLGFGMILVQEVSRSPRCFPEFWAKTLRAIVLSGPVLVSAMLVLAPLMLPVDGHWTVIMLIAAAELLAMPLVAVGSLAFQAHERLGRTIFNHVQLNLARLGAVLLLAVVGQDGLVVFAWAYLGATAMAAVLSLVQVRRAFGAPVWRMGGLADRRLEGLGFSLSVAANTAQGELDKTLLLRLGSATVAGNYSLANRVVSAATTPLIAYILATVPQLFREGKQGITAAAVLARRLLPPIVVYGFTAATTLFVCAPLLPWVFGVGFGAVVDIIPWLAPLPLLSGLSQLGLNVLTVSGRQRRRVSIEVMALLVNIGLNLVLIPLFGAVGTALAALISQALLCALPLAVILLMMREGDSSTRRAHG